MNLPSVKDLKIANKKVLLRTNYDVPLRLAGARSGQAFRVADTTRIEESLATINYLLEQKAKIVIVSHLGRPGGKKVAALSLRPIVEKLALLLRQRVREMGEIWEIGGVTVMENLRFEPGEEANDESFAKQLASLADFYINDAFAVSHRKHASIVGVPKFLPSAFGLDFLEEIETLSKIREKPKRPVVLILGGAKESKIETGRKLTSWADYILVGGALITYDGLPKMVDHQKILGSLTRKGEDITIETAKRFGKVIAKAKTIVWSGPMGAFEEKKFERGTREIGQAVVKSGAYTVIGGGDTEAALTKFGLVDKIDYVSSGGGAMLEFLAEGTLVGIEAIIKK